MGSQLDRIPSPELDLLAETASQFFADCVSQDIPTQEEYEDSAHNTQAEIEDSISHMKSFADRFHTDGVFKLQNLGKEKLPMETAMFNYIVLASQVLEKYIGLSSPDDPERRKKLRNKIDKNRELVFGKYHTSDEDTLEPQAGTSGWKRPKKEKKLSPQKKIRKNDSDSSDTTV